MGGTAAAIRDVCFAVVVLRGFFSSKLFCTYRLFYCVCVCFFVEHNTDADNVSTGRGRLDYNELVSLLKTLKT